MKIPSLSVITALALSIPSHAAIISAYDFQTGQAILSSPDTQKIYAANFGSGALYLNGSYTSSNWNAAAGAGINQLFAFTGTDVNTAGSPLATSTPSPSALVFRQPENAIANDSGANGYRITFAFSMTGYEGLSISYAARYQNANAFNNLTWEYSSDAEVWHTAAIHNSFSTTWAAHEIAAFSALDNEGTAYLRVTFNGAQPNPSTGRSFYMDNIRFEATAIPEPEGGALLAVGTVAAAAIWCTWRRRDRE